MAVPAGSSSKAGSCPTAPTPGSWRPPTTTATPKRPRARSPSPAATRWCQQLAKFTVTLPTFTPNQDGLDDRTGVSYYLNKKVDNVEVYLYDPAQPDVRYVLEEQERAVKPGEAGYHYYDYDGGVDRGADPPADGSYVVGG